MLTLDFYHRWNYLQTIFDVHRIAFVCLIFDIRIVAFKISPSHGVNHYRGQVISEQRKNRRKVKASG